jgi:2-keto-4-pentenoate hydratase/2-oxohepta-3-ene-1,7-dioic acid hydratase in catechol pathway
MVHAAEQPDGRAFLLRGSLFGELSVTSTPIRIAQLLTPIAPVMFWCIGLNYRRHAEETGAKVPEQPIVFAKGPNAALAPGAPIEIPQFLASEQVDYECELGVVIGRRCKNVSPAHALEYVLGYTCANDVSARDWQIKRGGSQWSPNALRIATRLNGETVQDSNTSDMIFDVAHLISFLSGSTTLLPGTVILTGTPEGVGMARTPPRWLEPGDEVAIEIENIGTLTNEVVLEGEREGFHG